MDQYELLSQEKHQSLRVNTEVGAAMGDSVMTVMTFPSEFRDIQSCFPILFAKDPGTGGFFASALLGFEDNQNLFLVEDKWEAGYIPMMVRRGPFMIATHEIDNVSRAAVSIDRHHPRLNEDKGEPLFDDAGEPSEYLQSTITMLEKIHRGMEHKKGFIDALLRHELLESITMDFSFSDGSKTSLQGFYTIAEEKLYALDGDALGELNQQGYLQPVFMAVASLSRFRSLIERKNTRSRADG